MAYIQIEYEEGYCECDFDYEVSKIYCMQCNTQAASDLGCKYFDNGEEKNHQGVRVIPYGNCIHALTRKKYKGMSVKNYEIEEMEYPFNELDTCMELTTRGRKYCCSKVVLDGVLIYQKDGEE
jgi:hypothetical protein